MIRIDQRMGDAITAGVPDNMPETVRKYVPIVSAGVTASLLGDGCQRAAWLKVRGMSSSHDAPRKVGIRTSDNVLIDAVTNTLIGMGAQDGVTLEHGGVTVRVDAVLDGMPCLVSVMGAADYRAAGRCKLQDRVMARLAIASAATGRESALLAIARDTHAATCLITTVPVNIYLARADDLLGVCPPLIDTWMCRHCDVATVCGTGVTETIDCASCVNYNHTVGACSIGRDALCDQYIQVQCG